MSGVFVCARFMFQIKKARQPDCAGLLHVLRIYIDSINRPANKIRTTPMVRSNQCPMRMNSNLTLGLEKNSATITNHRAFTKHIHTPYNA